MSGQQLVVLAADRRGYSGGLKKIGRYFISVPLFVVGTWLALYGGFALVYNADGGSTYIKIAGRHMDAHLAGGISLAIAALLAAFGVLALRGDD